MRQRRAVIALLIVGLFALGAGAAAWALVLRGDEVAPLALPSSAPGAASGAAPTSSNPSVGGSATESLPAASAGTVDAATLPGAWSIAPGSVVGYRVRERLASLSADSDAVGRTSSITGSATIAGGGPTLTLTAASFSVDMTTLRSDRSMRDNRLRNDGIQTDQFPTATFELTQPVGLPASALRGPFDVTLHGDLTLHGVTKSVEIPAQAQLNGAVIQVLGSLEFPFSDFQINAPNIGGFVAVEDHGTLEFLVNLAKA
ncbi:MAG TPA: YceI family protein [Candidatus Limnocylindrales bacterium]|nr:YceI family protein [Candidatus Limnocylindrales bacterium]